MLFAIAQEDMDALIGYASRVTNLREDYQGRREKDNLVAEYIEDIKSKFHETLREKIIEQIEKS